MANEITVMRKVILLIIGVFFSLLGKAQSENALYVWRPDGTNVVYLLEQRPKVTFTDKNLVFATEQITVNYPLSDYVKVTFGTYDRRDDGIKDVATRATYRISSTSVEISNLLPNEMVAIYSIKGENVAKGVADKEGRVNLSTASLSRGVYIVKTNSINFKIIKK